MNNHKNTVEQAFDAAYDAGMINDQQYEDNFWDEIWRRVAQDTGLRYRRRKK
ncbi:MAG: hypothetical protein ACOYMG_17605 [Candidatus Methylumidiphilus sp.]